jgi:hypothetical protein
MVIADLPMRLLTNRKRITDSSGPARTGSGPHRSVTAARRSAFLSNRKSVSMTLPTSLQVPTTAQPRGLGLADPDSRVGVGPTDHNVVTPDGCTVMVPMHTGGAGGSCFLDAASHETAAGEWSGSRLAVHRDFRRVVWSDTARLRHAVGTARARGGNRSNTDVTVSPVARCAE